MTPIINIIKRWFTFLQYLQRSYINDGCKNSAAALTYISLFALIPLLTVMYAMLSAVPAFQAVGKQVENIVFTHLVPSSAYEMRNYLDQFSQQTRQLSGIGVVVLFVTAVLMLRNIERTFNAIWKTHSNRGKISSLLLYWAVLSLGPLCIGLAFGINAYLKSLNGWLTGVDINIPLLLYTTPLLLTTLAFSLLFAAVPNCKVPLKHALFGGLMTAIVFEVAKQLFAVLAAKSSYQVVYGTFAVVPLFLLWIYLSWLIVLSGAELVHALSGYSIQSRHLFSDRTLCLGILAHLWKNYQAGKAIMEHDLLSQPWLFGCYTIASDQWAPLRNRLIEHGLLHISSTDGYIVGRDFHRYTLWDLNCIMNFPLEPSPLTIDNPPHWLTYSQQLFTELQANNKQAMSVSLAELLEERPLTKP